MANLDAPMGYRPIENGVAGITSRLRMYPVTASLAVYEGDLVALNSTGTVVAYTTTDAVAGNLIGVAAHHVSATATDRNLAVYDDPNQVFEAQADDGTITNAALAKFKLFKPVIATGNTTTLQSKHEIDASATSSLFGTVATQVYPIQVLKPSGAINNTAYTTYTRYECQIHPSAHLRGTGGYKLGASNA